MGWSDWATWITAVNVHLYIHHSIGTAGSGLIRNPYTLMNMQHCTCIIVNIALEHIRFISVIMRLEDHLQTPCGTEYSI